jgi:nucleoside-diphosphate-sugar epimerase
LAEQIEGIFNLFSPDTLELQALAAAVRAATESRSSVEDASQERSVPTLVFDNGRLMAAFRPSFTPLTEGLRKTAAWLKTCPGGN